MCRFCIAGEHAVEIGARIDDRNLAACAIGKRFGHLYECGVESYRPESVEIECQILSQQDVGPDHRVIRPSSKARTWPRGGLVPALLDSVGIVFEGDGAGALGEANVFGEADRRAVVNRRFQGGSRMAAPRINRLR